MILFQSQRPRHRVDAVPRKTAHRSFEPALQCHNDPSRRTARTFLIHRRGIKTMERIGIVEAQSIWFVRDESKRLPIELTQPVQRSPDPATHQYMLVSDRKQVWKLKSVDSRLEKNPSLSPV